MRAAVTRPALRYHGGKWKLAPWILQHLPKHRTYVEPFGGGASVLLRKERAYAEVYNDLDGEICNLFRVARDDGERLAIACELTPFGRDDFVESYEQAGSPLEQARRTVARSFMGFGSGAASGQSTGFRAASNMSGTTPARDWMNYPDALRATIQRLRGVVIENRDAMACMGQHDGPDTLHYCDPPYVFSSRSDAKADYRFEMSDDDHAAFAAAVKDLRGMVVVSGYRTDLYDDLFEGWVRVDRAARADGAAKRVESLWLNPACADALHYAPSGLFAEVA